MTWNWLLRLLAVSDDTHVSDRWRLEQARREERVGIDGPSWRFPVRKITDEHGLFNRQRLRKRA